MAKDLPDAGGNPEGTHLWIIGAAHLPGLIIGLRETGWPVEHKDMPADPTIASYPRNKAQRSPGNNRIERPENEAPCRRREERQRGPAGDRALGESGDRPLGQSHRIAHPTNLPSFLISRRTPATRSFCSIICGLRATALRQA